jgi:hypothetical protein
MQRGAVAVDAGRLDFANKIFGGLPATDMSPIR